MPEKKPTKSYKLTSEALDAIDALDEAIEGKFKSEIVSEAIIQYALAHKIKIKGRKKKETIQGLAKRAEKLEQTVKALCRTALDYECDLQKQLDETKAAIAQSLTPKTRSNPRALWKQAEEKLPECMQSQDLFMIYLGGHGMPKMKG